MAPRHRPARRGPLAVDCAFRLSQPATGSGGNASFPIWAARCAHALKAVIHCPKPGHPMLRLFQGCCVTPTGMAEPRPFAAAYASGVAYTPTTTGCARRLPCTASIRLMASGNRAATSRAKSSARLIVHLAIGRQGGQSIGYIPQARDHVACRGPAKSCPCADDDQRQRCSDDHPDDTTTHGSSPAVCEAPNG